MKKLILTFSLVCITISGIAQTQVIAHRGFWDTTGSAQNSIAALVKADSTGCYGSEFDVWLTKDDMLVVNHDASFNSHGMEKTKANKLTSQKLKNGENLPSLKDYLKKGKQLDTRLILELKKHSSPERETLAVEKIVEMVKKYGLEDRIEYISFSLHAVKEFIRLSPNAPVYYLNGELSPKELKEIGCAGPDYHLGVYKKHPEWIEECHKLGLKVNAWTVNKKKDMEWLIDLKADFITTDNPLLLKETIK